MKVDASRSHVGKLPYAVRHVACLGCALHHFPVSSATLIWPTTQFSCCFAAGDWLVQADEARSKLQAQVDKLRKEVDSLSREKRQLSGKAAQQGKESQKHAEALQVCCCF